MRESERECERVRESERERERERVCESEGEIISKKKKSESEQIKMGKRRCCEGEKKKGAKNAQISPSRNFWMNSIRESLW